MKEFRRRGGALRTVAAFGLGAALGSVIALLYAPASGKVTRRRLALRVRTMRRTAIRRLGDTQRALTTGAVRVREAASEWIADRMNGKHPIRHRTARHAHAN
jgi:gas vesicle protein